MKRVDTSIVQSSPLGGVLENTRQPTEGEVGMVFSAEVMSRIADALRAGFEKGDLQIDDSDVEVALIRLTQDFERHPSWNEILIRRFSGNSQPFAAIGAHLGLSRARVSQIHAGCLWRIYRAIYYGKQNHSLNGVDVLDRSVHSLNLSIRALNCLISARVSTIRDLVQISGVELLKVQNLGVHSLVEIKDALAQFRLEIGMGESLAKDVLVTSITPKIKAVEMDIEFDPEIPPADPAYWGLKIDGGQVIEVIWSDRKPMAAHFRAGRPQAIGNPYPGIHSLHVVKVSVAEASPPELLAENWFN